MKNKILVWLKNFWTKNKTTLIMIGVIFILLFVVYHLGRYSTREERVQQRENLIAARDSVKNYSIKVSGLEFQVAEKSAIILTKDEVIKTGIIERDYLKKLHFKELTTNAELRGLIKILRDSLDLPPETIVITIKDTNGVYHDYTRIPFKLLDIKEPYLTLIAGMDKNRKAYFDLSTPVIGEMTIGYVKDGFMKTKPVGVFISPNKYLGINNMDILIVKDEKRWHQKTWVHMVGGIVIYEGARQGIKYLFK